MSKDSIKFPQKIGHAYTFNERLDLNLLHSDLASHRRLRVFHTYGTRCYGPSCNKEGIYLIKALDRFGKPHIDLYTENFELMTIDHILPKSKGGSRDIENLQPMCATCNTQKDNK